MNAVDAIISEKKRYMDENGIVFNWEGSACELPMRLEIFVKNTTSSRLKPEH